jgi:hypothetical protein
MSNSAAAATTGAAAKPVQVQTEVKLVLDSGFAGMFLEYTGSSDIKLFTAEYALEKRLDPFTLGFRTVPATQRAAAELADDVASARAVGERLTGSEVPHGAVLIAIGREKPAAAPSSTTGKCPHSFVFPSVARSSLTWCRALCLRCCRGWCRDSNFVCHGACRRISAPRRAHACLVGNERRNCQAASNLFLLSCGCVVSLGCSF